MWMEGEGEERRPESLLKYLLDEFCDARSGDPDLSLRTLQLLATGGCEAAEKIDLQQMFRKA